MFISRQILLHKVHQIARHANMRQWCYYNPQLEAGTSMSRHSSKCLIRRKIRDSRLYRRGCLITSWITMVVPMGMV